MSTRSFFNKTDHNGLSIPPTALTKRHPFSGSNVRVASSPAANNSASTRAATKSFFQAEKSSREYANFEISDDISRSGNDESQDAPNIFSAHIQPKPCPPLLDSLIANSARTATPLRSHHQLPNHHQATLEPPRHVHSSSPNVTLGFFSDSPLGAYTQPISMSPASSTLPQVYLHSSAAVCVPQVFRTQQTESGRQQSRENAEALPSESETDQSSTLGADDDARREEEIRNFQFSLMKENAELRSAKKEVQRLYENIVREAEDYRVRLNSGSTELSSLRHSVVTSKEDCARKCAEIDSLKCLLANTEEKLDSVLKAKKSLKEQMGDLKSRNDVLSKAAEDSKRRIAEAIKAFSEIRPNFVDLKDANDQSRTRILALSKEADSLRNIIQDNWKSIEPLLQGDFISEKAGHTRAAFYDMQAALNNSQEVTEILRIKLLEQSSQLADVNGRVRDLEEEKEGVLKDLLDAKREESRDLRRVLDIEKSMAELSANLVAREKEAIEQSQDLEKALSESRAKSVELDSLKEVCIGHINDLQEGKKVKDESVSRLLVLQDIINTRDKEMAVFMAELKAKNETIAELRILLAEAKRNLGERKAELRAQDQCQNQALEDSNANLAATLRVAEDKYIQLEAKTSERIVTLENANTMLENITETLKNEVAAAHRELDEIKYQGSVLVAKYDAAKAEVMRENVELKERLNIQSLDIYAAKEDCAKLKERLDAKDIQIQSVTEMVSLADRNSASMTARLDIANSKMDQLEAKNLRLHDDLDKAKRETIEVAKGRGEARDEALKQYRDEMTGLERCIVEMRRSDESLLERFQRNELSNVERKLVKHIMEQAQNIHEQDLFGRDSELHRRKLSIDALNSQVAELKVTVARLMKDKDDISKESIIGLKRFLPPSSPVKGIHTHVGSAAANPSEEGFRAIDVESGDDALLLDPKHPMILNRNAIEGEISTRRDAAASAKLKRSRSPGDVKAEKVENNHLRVSKRMAALDDIRSSGANDAVSRVKTSKKVAEGPTKTLTKQRKRR